MYLGLFIYLCLLWSPTSVITLTPTLITPTLITPCGHIILLLVRCKCIRAWPGTAPPPHAVRIECVLYLVPRAAAPPTTPWLAAPIRKVRFVLIIIIFFL